MSHPNTFFGHSLRHYVAFFKIESNYPATQLNINFSFFNWHSFGNSNSEGKQ